MPKLSLAKLERHLHGAADILRREGMDAATYKDFIFGMLFLKRCSDLFEADYEKIVQKKTGQGLKIREAEASYGENPDCYDDFFVPPRARRSHLQGKLNDASEPYGAVPDKALAAISQANESLRYVLDRIRFMKVQSNKRIVSDEACKELVRHFNRYRLRNEDFQIRREYIEQSGGDSTDLRLRGQANDASAWSIRKIDMLPHGIRGADIRLEDTLPHPLHREGGELERFDRAIANPPFSLRPEDIEKIASTFERYGEVENYSKIAAFDEIADSANDFNLYVRRYVDNSPPPEPHDVRAHLIGGIPVAEIEANGALFEALGFSPDALFARRPDDDRYRGFKPGIAERPAVSRLIEADAGLLARTRSLRDALTAWRETHTGSLIALPQGRNLNAVRKAADADLLADRIRVPETVMAGAGCE